MNLWRPLIFAAAAGFLTPPAFAAEKEEHPPPPPLPDLICCGWDEVFVIPADPLDAGAPAAVKTWSWRAPDSPEIPAALHRTFRSTDDCKPYEGGLILITSSSNGVALVRRSDKSCLFLATARNAHSACLLPGDRLAVAASNGGDRLLVFDRSGPAKAGSEALVSIPLKGAHGAHWDGGRSRLWALGEHELLRCKLGGGGDSEGAAAGVSGAEEALSLEVERRWQLPTHGGHDLSPLPTPLPGPGAPLGGFFVTSNSRVYNFLIEPGIFEPHPALADEAKMKSVDQFAPGGPTVFHRASETNWWSDTVRFAGPDRVIRLEGERLYKVRWDRPAPVP